MIKEIIKFSTPSCGQCKVVDMMLKKAGMVYRDVDCTIDSMMPEVEKYNITHVPTIVVETDEGTKILNNIPEVKQFITHNS